MTEQEEIEIDEAIRQINFMEKIIKGEFKATCQSCKYSAYEKGEMFVTCIVHLENFKADSLCAQFKPVKQP